jgi:hypothetical protein
MKEEVDVVRARLLATTARIEDIRAEIGRLSDELQPLLKTRTDDRAVLDPEHTVSDPGNGMTARQKGAVGPSGRLDIPEIKNLIASFTPVADVRALAHSSRYWAFLQATTKYRVSVLLAYAVGEIAPTVIPAGTHMAYANGNLCIVYPESVVVQRAGTPPRRWDRSHRAVGPRFGVRALSSAFDRVGVHDRVKVRMIMGATDDCILIGDGDAVVISDKGLQATSVHIRGDANTATHDFTLKENGTDVRIHIGKHGEETGTTFVCPQIGDPTDPFLTRTPRAVVLAKPNLMYVLYGTTVYAFKGGKRIRLNDQKAVADDEPGLDVGYASCLDVSNGVLYVGLDYGVAVYHEGVQRVFINTEGPVCEIAAGDSVLFVHHKYHDDRDDVILSYSNPTPP